MENHILWLNMVMIKIYNGAKNAIIKSNHQKIKQLILAIIGIAAVGLIMVIRVVLKSQYLNLITKQQ